MVVFLILLLGVWLRFHALVRDVRFHPDEALFSTFARAAALNGEWLLPGALDKTPLAIYANALAQVFVGNSEFAARLPGTLASILLLAVMYALAKALYPRSPLVPLFSLTLTALSPFAIAFSATALTDGLMLLLMTLALWLAARGRWLWCGVLLGLAFASKQQALFYLPLVIMLAPAIISRGALRDAPAHVTAFSVVVRFCAGFGAVALILLLWDGARSESSLFALAAANNNPARLVRANEILPRLNNWIAHSGGLLVAGVFALGALVYRVIKQARRRSTLVDLILFTYLAGYGWLHWLVAFNTYDRYLLPALPLVILLAARGVELLDNLSTRFRLLKTVLAWVVLLGLLWGAFAASSGQTGINNEGAKYEGIDALAAYLNSKPVAAVIYDHWLGWQLDYYLGEWHDKRRVYYPAPDALVRDALKLCETGARYFPAPAGEAAGPWLEALRSAGFTVTEAYRSPRFVAYKLLPPANRAAACP